MMNTTITAAIQNVPAAGRFGSKVFIRALYAAVTHETDMTYPQFQRWLVAQHRAGALELCRADFTNAMNPAMVAASLTVDSIGSEFHFVVVA